MSPDTTRARQRDLDSPWIDLREQEREADMGILDRPTPQPTTRSGKPRCQEIFTFYMSGWPHSKQCDRCATVGDRCKQHSPEAKTARQEASRQKEESSWNHRKVEIHSHSLLRALREIANGHNDPMTLARDVLERTGLGRGS